MGKGCGTKRDLEGDASGEDALRGCESTTESRAERILDECAIPVVVLDGMEDVEADATTYRGGGTTFTEMSSSELSLNSMKV